MPPKIQKTLSVSVDLPVGIVVTTNVDTDPPGSHPSEFFDGFLGNFSLSNRSATRRESTEPIKLTLEVPRDSIVETASALRALADALEDP